MQQALPIIRDSNGNPSVASTKHVEHASINVVESQDLREALRRALNNKDFWKIQIEGNSKLLLDSVNGATKTH